MEFVKREMLKKHSIHILYTPTPYIGCDVLHMDPTSRERVAVLRVCKECFCNAPLIKLLNVKMKYLHNYHSHD